MLFAFLILFSSIVPSTVTTSAEGISKVEKIIFEENKESTRTKVISIPSSYRVENITVNNGDIDYQVSGNELEITVSNGKAKTVQTGGEFIPAHTKFVINQPSTNYSDADGYVGTLIQYVHSGSYTPTHTKTVTTTRSGREAVCSWSWDGSRWYADGGFHLTSPASIQYNSGGYSGTLYRTDTERRACNANTDIGRNGRYRGEQVQVAIPTVTYYTGNVTKPAVDTRVFRYQGDVTRPAIDTRTYEDVFSYEVTIQYEIDSDFMQTEGLSFNGTNQFVEVNSLNTPAKTIEFIINAGEIKNSMKAVPVLSFSDTHQNEIFLGEISGYADGETIMFQTNEGTIAQPIYNRTYIKDVIPGGWNHVTFVWNDYEKRYDIYVNGEMKTVYKSKHPELDMGWGHVPLQTIDKMFIGKLGDPAASHFHYEGLIKDVRLWNRTLTEQEIRNQLFKELNGTEQGLEGYWVMDNVTTEIVYDKTSNQNNGSVIGYTSPLAINADKVLDTSIDLSWNSMSNSTKYEIKRDGTTIYEGNKNSFSDRSLSPGTNYDYEIRAKNENGISVPSVNSFKTSFINPEKAISFNGINQSFEMDNVSVNTTNNGKNTVEMWIKFSSREQQSLFFSWNNLYTLSKTIHGIGINMGHGDSLGAPFPYENEWVHVTAVFNNGLVNNNTVKLYFNGERQNLRYLTSTIPPQETRTATPKFKISHWYARQSQYFQGEVASVAVWNHERTQAQIQQDMKQINSNQNGLVGYWKFDPLTTGKAYDQTVNNNPSVSIGYEETMQLSEGSVTDMAATLHWNEAAHATKYELKRNGQTVFEGNQTSFADEPLISDTEYSYEILAKNENGESLPSTKTVKTQEGELAILSVPSNLALSPITLNGETQLSKGTFSDRLIIKDTRKERSGWTLNISASPLKSIDELRTFANNNIKVNPVKVRQTAGEEGVMPQSISNTISIDNNNTNSLMTAGNGVGLGIYEIEFPQDFLEISIPASTYVNRDKGSLNYQSNISWLLR